MEEAREHLRSSAIGAEERATGERDTTAVLSSLRLGRISAIIIALAITFLSTAGGAGLPHCARSHRWNVEDPDLDARPKTPRILSSSTSSPNAGAGLQRETSPRYIYGKVSPIFAVRHPRARATRHSPIRRALRATTAKRAPSTGQTRSCSCSPTSKTAKLQAEAGRHAEMRLNACVCVWRPFRSSS
ncbi:hypothetical protein KM043_002678 [Ampulex compressa]|nr:hypothetical protein KM043_002678 [Ampulex compressa]